MQDISVPHCLKCQSNENVTRVWKCINLGGGMSNKASSSTGCNSCSSGSCSTCK